MDDSLFGRISSLAEQTPADRKLAAYMEGSFPDVALENLATIAEANQLSAASVTRFVRKLGYTDFKDFSAAVRREVAANYDRPLQRGIEPIPQQAGGEVTRHLRRSIDDIERTLSTISLDQFADVAALLGDESRPLFLGSTATGRSLVQYFYLLSCYVRTGVHLLPGADMMAHELVDLSSESVLFATAFDRHPKALDTSLRLAHSIGATTILLTNRSASPLRRYCDYVLMVYADPTPLFKSRATMLLVLESLLIAMERQAPARTLERTERLEQIVQELGLLNLPRK
ncbi:MurR/RpiR family transcriptional regulator [Nigerium massiliense]|uniref:MurR/RpiR family transcriptional regulator n=1 Tax=Nigerium massiliense TaxID=1522317 RepID=UPI00058E60ED|nr:MurR/RpiR family transcriptional regulator [Nigerium massiliense]